MAGLLFSLQSCVSNYVVATPSAYKPETLAEEKSHFTSLTQEYKKELESNKAIEKTEEKTVSARKMAKKWARSRCWIFTVRSRSRSLIEALARSSR